MFEDTKVVIRICKSKQDRNHNSQRKKNKKRSTIHTHKTKVRVTWTPLKTGGQLRCTGRVGSFCSTSGTRRVNLVNSPYYHKNVFNYGSSLSDKGNLCWFRLSCFVIFGWLLPKTFTLSGFPICWLSVPDKSYTKNGTFALIS